MAAENLGCIWKKNVLGASAPFKYPFLFGAGASQAVKQGEILDVNTGTAVPLASDKAMSAILVVACEEVRSGDLAGYRMCIVPRPGDVFELALSATAAPGLAVAAPLYFSTSQILASTGTNILGYTVDDSVIPVQGQNSVNPSYDAGTTFRSQGSVLFAFKQAASFFAGLFI